MTRHRRSALALVAGALLLALGWRITPRSAPPLYDGLVTTVDPYRYVSPPPGINHPKPDAFTQDFPLQDGKSPAIAEATNESPAQAQLLVQGDSFVLPAGATMVTVTIAPVEAPAQKPAEGFLDGNIYRFSVSVGSTPLALRPGVEATIVLRGPPGAGDVTVEQFNGTSWSKLVTTPVGAPDTYAGNVTALGDLALVATQAATTTTQSTPGGGGGGGSNGAVIAALVAGGVVVIAAAAIVAIRGRAASAERSVQRGGGPRGPPRGPGRDQPRGPRRKPPRRR